MSETKIVYYWNLRNDIVQFYEKSGEGMYIPIGRYTTRKAQFAFLDCEKRELPCAAS